MKLLQPVTTPLSSHVSAVAPLVSTLENLGGTPADYWRRILEISCRDHTFYRLVSYNVHVIKNRSGSSRLIASGGALYIAVPNDNPKAANMGFQDIEALTYTRPARHTPQAGADGWYLGLSGLELGHGPYELAKGDRSLLPQIDWSALDIDQLPTMLQQPGLMLPDMSTWYRFNGRR
jgi:hypothetical protein